MTGNQEDEVIIYQIQLETHNIDLCVFIYMHAYINTYVYVGYLYWIFNYSSVLYFHIDYLCPYQ